MSRRSGPITPLAVPGHGLLSLSSSLRHEFSASYGQATVVLYKLEGNRQSTVHTIRESW